MTYTPHPRSAKPSLQPLTGAVMPTRTLAQGAPYTPSWHYEPRTTWSDRLGGHYGIVGPLEAIKSTKK